MESKNIILIGFMGAGKSSVGRELAKELGYNFVDIDDKIEKSQNVSIKRIFSDEGEEFFRNLETIELSKLKDKGNLVISTGGGLPCRDENKKILNELGTIVYLRGSTEIICERLKDDTSRPLIKNKDNIETLMNKRAKVYENLADIIIDVDKKTIKDIVIEIIKREA